MSEESPPSGLQKSNFCSRCGNPIKNPEAKFCGKCGYKINQIVGEKSSAEVGVTEKTGSPDIDKTYTRPYSTPAAVASQPPQYIPGIDPINTQKQTNQSFQQSPYSNAYSDQRARTSDSSKHFITPNQIQPVTTSVFVRAEINIIAIISVMAFLSHLFRYLFMYNRFPSVLEIIIPLPFYLLAIFIIFFFQKKKMQNSGVMTTVDADRYDFMLSLVLSTFFASTMSHRSKIDHELTTIPDKIHIPESSKYGLTYVEVPKMEYIGGNLQPKMYLFSSFLASILALFSLILYFEVNDPIFISTFRLLSAYMGGYVIMEIGPGFGRHNNEISRIGKYKSLLLFIFAFCITIIALLGESFFVALTNR